MHRLKKGLFIAMAALLGGYAALCLGLYQWGLHAWPEVSEAPPPVLPPALVEQISALEGLAGQPMPRLDPLTLPVRAGWTLPSGDTQRAWLSTLANVARPRGRGLASVGSGGRMHMAELAFAIRISRHWSRAQVLSARAGDAYYGRGAHDLDAAARAWFGVPAGQLQAQEVAALWVLQAAPAYHDPFCHRDRFARRYAVYAARVGAAAEPADVQRLLARMTPAACT
jgi:hypothetical protein